IRDLIVTGVQTCALPICTYSGQNLNTSPTISALPIALTIEDADAILAASERSGKALMVGLVLRFWPEYVRLQQLVQAGGLGRPRSEERRVGKEGWVRGGG